MTKGTASMGKRSKGKSHIRCRRCGKHTYHPQKKRCSSCRYGQSSKVRSYNWKKERKR